MALPGGISLPESQVMESYMLDKYKGVGPDLIPSKPPEARAAAALAARFVWYTLPVLVYLLRSHIFQLYIVVHV